MNRPAVMITTSTLVPPRPLASVGPASSVPTLTLSIQCMLGEMVLDSVSAKPYQESYDGDMVTLFARKCRSRYLLFWFGPRCPEDLGSAVCVLLG